MNTNDIPKAHPELLDALHRQDEQARQMTLSEGFTEKVMNKVKGEKPHSPWVFRKVAAVFVIATFLGGLSFAAYHVFSPAQEQQPTENETTFNSQLSTFNSSPEGLVRFSNVRLDSILTTISAHYGKRVCFRCEEPRGMKLITTWNPADSLAAFIDHLNMFDYLHLTLQDDTIFVEQTGEED